MVVHSDEYAAQLRSVHAGRRAGKEWGTTGARNFGDYVCKSLEHRRGFIRTVLDFGCGQGSLGKYVADNAIDLDHVQWTNYDPGMEQFAVLPEGPFDCVVSSDVLEHVEPEHIDGTIDQLYDLGRKMQFHHIACDPCGLTLPDGRNAHLITEPLDWWLAKFERPEWQLVYAADRWELKRGVLRRSCHIMKERKGS